MSASQDIALVDRLRIVADATRLAIADPADTKQAFRLVGALAFNTPARLTRRFRATATGQRRLRERRRVLDALLDRAALAAMPAGSFGRAYLAFLEREGITADGLVAASLEAHGDAAIPTELTDEEFVQQELRDMHDLWHTVTGYQADLLGEAAVLAFSFAQTGHPGVGFLGALGFVLAPERELRRFIIDGFRRGRAAAWLPAQDWAALLPLPLDEVRARLGITPVGAYERAELPVAAAA